MADQDTEQIKTLKIQNKMQEVMLNNLNSTVNTLRGTVNTLRGTVASQKKTIEQSEEKYTKIGEEKEKLRRKQEMEQKKQEEERKRAEKARQAASRAKSIVHQDHLALGDDNFENSLDALSTALKYLSPVDSKELLENWLFIHSGDRTKLEPLIYSIDNVDKLIYKAAYDPVKDHVGSMSAAYQKIYDAMIHPDTITETQREKFNQMVRSLKKKYDGPSDGMKLLWDMSSLGRFQLSPFKHMKIALKIFQKVHQVSSERSSFSLPNDTNPSMFKKIQGLLATVTDESTELDYMAIITEVSKMLLEGKSLLLNVETEFLKKMWTEVYGAGHNSQ